MIVEVVSTALAQIAVFGPPIAWMAWKLRRRPVIRPTIHVRSSTPPGSTR